MNADHNTTQSLIEAASRALDNGDRRAARHFAEQAVALDPQAEQPWLLLAFLASPKAAQYYLDRALQANPGSQRVLAAKEWLKSQVSQGGQSSVPDLSAAPAIITQPQNTEPASLDLSAAPAFAEQPQSAEPASPDLSTAPAISDKPHPGPAPRRALRYAAMLVVVVAVLTGLIALGGPPRPAESQDDALISIVKTVLNAATTQAPSLTPSLTWTASPTATYTSTYTATPSATLTQSSTPTHTASPTPTHTSTPTALPTHTPLPSPTPTKIPTVGDTSYKVVPGDTLSLIAQRYNISLQTLIAANNLDNPSIIRAGQVITIPAAGSKPASVQPTAGSAQAGPGIDGKRILIDISEQHLYAYQNDELVFSFVASTGIGNSTRIGTFKVLDKIPNAYSNAFNIWMPYWMGIYYSGTLENGIHGLPKLWNGVELWGNLLGKPATYGCIETKTSEAKALYDWSVVGMPVVIQR